MLIVIQNIHYARNISNQTESEAPTMTRRQHWWSVCMWRDKIHSGV